MRALCPRCNEMVTVWPLLGLPDARRLLEANKPIVVVHVCTVVAAITVGQSRRASLWNSRNWRSFCF